MNVNTNRIMTRTIFLLVLAAANASAHEVEYRPYYVQSHYVDARSRFYPAWLRRNREFQRWYMRNQYRFQRHIGWHRLFDIYRFEKRRQWHGRRIYARHYRDYDYRPYYVVPKKHRH